MQLLSPKTDETTAWVKIIENISVIVKHDKIDHATKGEWRTGLYRCLSNLLVDAGKIEGIRVNTIAHRTLQTYLHCT